jgi:hypothetical protein
VLYLCEHYKIDAVVIAADVEDPDAIEAQMRHICLKLKPNATVKDVMWELENLFGKAEHHRAVIPKMGICESFLSILF